MPPTNHLILGIDPGLSATGFALIDARRPSVAPLAMGEIKTPARAPLAQRLRKIHDGVVKLVEHHRPGAVAVEDIFVRINAKSAQQLAQARGVAILAATLHGADLFEYAPAEIKKLVAGSGRASKEQVMAMVNALVALPKRRISDHAADALAAALCHRQHLNFQAVGGKITQPRGRSAKRRAWGKFVAERGGDS